MEKNIAAFIRTDAKTIGVRFFTDIDWSKGRQAVSSFDQFVNDPDFLTNDMSAKTYTYVASQEVAVNDWVVVKALGQLKVALVVRVDDGVCIEPNSETKFKWVVAKIDPTEYEANEEKNTEIETLIQDAYKVNIKKQFQNVIMAGLDAGGKKKLKSLLDGK